MIVAARRTPSPTVLGLLGVMVAAWVISVWAEVTGAAVELHHHTLYHL